MGWMDWLKRKSPDKNKSINPTDEREFINQLVKRASERVNAEFSEVDWKAIEKIEAANNL